MSGKSNLFLCALASAISLFGQTSAGEITGVVSDPSGAVVPNAAIEILGAETGDLVRKLATNGEGAFSAPLLRPGAIQCCRDSRRLQALASLPYRVARR